MKVERKYYVVDGYEVESFYDTDDELFVALIPALAGCAVDGETREESLHALLDWKAEWIAEVAKHGHPVPQPKFEPGMQLA